VQAAPGPGAGARHAAHPFCGHGPQAGQPRGEPVYRSLSLQAASNRHTSLLSAVPCNSTRVGSTGTTLWCYRVLQGDRRLEEQLATLLESRMEMDAEWSAAQAQATQPQVGLLACTCVQPRVAVA
jgi:hypothetical protein